MAKQPTPSREMSADEAYLILQSGGPLTDVYIHGRLDIDAFAEWNHEIHLEHCVLEFLSGNGTQFLKPVNLVSCRFLGCQFGFSYFLAGLTIDNCTFTSYLDFQAGGHNKHGYPILLKNSDFFSFVNFFDCWFESDVVITKCTFRGGTNLLGSPFGIPVTFDSKITVEDNVENWIQMTKANLFKVF